MFVGGTIGLIIGLYFIYIVNLAFKRLQEQNLLQAQAITTLTELVKALDYALVGELKLIDKKLFKDIQSINSPAGYQAVLAGDTYDIYEEYKDEEE